MGPEAVAGDLPVVVSNHAPIIPPRVEERDSPDLVASSLPAKMMTSLELKS